MFLELRHQWIWHIYCCCERPSGSSLFVVAILIVVVPWSDADIWKYFPFSYSQWHSLQQEQGTLKTWTLKTGTKKTEPDCFYHIIKKEMDMIYCYDISENTVTCTTYAKLEIENFEECVFFCCFFFVFVFVVFLYRTRTVLSRQGQDSFFLKIIWKEKMVTFW